MAQLHIVDHNLVKKKNPRLAPSCSQIMHMLKVEISIEIQIMRLKLSHLTALKEVFENDFPSWFVYVINRFMVRY